MTLTKADIVVSVYATGLLTKAEAASAVETSLSLIKDSLASSQEVLISGFGKWSVRQKAQRRGRNPQTGEPLILPPRKVVTFRPSRVLKAKVQDHGQGSQAPAAAPTEQASGSEDKPSGKVLRPGYF